MSGTETGIRLWYRARCTAYESGRHQGQVPRWSGSPDEENDVGNRPARDRHGEDVPHLVRIPSIAWSLELDLAQYPVPGILFSPIQRVVFR